LFHVANAKASAKNFIPDSWDSDLINRMNVDYKEILKFIPPSMLNAYLLYMDQWHVPVKYVTDNS
jgi:hypothetical protein